MKPLLSLLAVAAIIGGIFLISTGGCEARSKVAGKKILDSIDKMLGELNVKRQMIEDKIQTLDKAIGNVREQKVAADVQLKMYKDKIAPVQAEVDKIKSAMEKIRPMMNSEDDVELKGKTYTQAQLTEMANELVDEYTKLNKRIGSYETSISAFQESYDLLSAQYDSAVTTMKQMKEQLEEIDVKKEAIDSMKTAQTILGEGGSISDEFTELKKEIDEMFVKVETGMAVEKEKISERERDLNSATKSVDTILGDLESGEETKSRLDAILGDDK